MKREARPSPAAHPTRQIVSRSRELSPDLWERSSCRGKEMELPGWIQRCTEMEYFVEYRVKRVYRLKRKFENQDGDFILLYYWDAND